MLLLEGIQEKTPTGSVLRKTSWVKGSPLSMVEFLEAGKKSAFSQFLRVAQSSFFLGNTGLWPEILHVRAVFIGNMAYRLYLYQ